MSALNGNKSRFQRLRKAGLRRRDKSRLVVAAMQLAAAERAAGSGEAGSGGGPGPQRNLRLVADVSGTGVRA